MMTGTPSRRNPLLRWIGYLALGILLLLLTLVGVGAIWQATASASDARAYPAPGILVDAGGHNLHLNCTGEGSPVVVLDTIADGTSSYWAWVQPRIAEVTRVCSYDRTGFAWSEGGDGPRDARTAAAELHAALQNAGEAGPWLMVGHSHGASVVRLFHADYPEDVLAMVLVDPGTQRLDPRLPEAHHEGQRQGEMLATIGQVLAPIGLFRLSEMGLALTSSLPVRQQEEFNAFFSTRAYWNAIAAQNRAYAETSAQIAAIDSMGDLPLLVLSADTPDDETRKAWSAINAETALLSSQGVHRVVPNSTHVGLATDEATAQTTADAILEMLARIR